MAYLLDRRPKQMPRRKLHCIVRIDVPKRQHCWEVKIIRPKNSFHRSFSDSKYGGKARALIAALECRDQELKMRPPLNAFEQAIRPKRNNRSGIVGVRRTRRVVRRGDKSWIYDVWAVTGTPVSGGKTKTRYFPINGMGEKNARVAAMTLRREWEESLRESVEAKLRSAPNIQR